MEGPSRGRESKRRGASPLVGRRTGGSDKLESLHFKPLRTELLVIFQLTIILIYTALTFVLPREIDFFSEIRHVAAVHVAVFVICGGLHLASQAEQRVVLFHGYLELHRKTRLLSQIPFSVASAVNAILLLLVGLDQWFGSRLRNEPLTQLSLEVIACLEAGTCAVAVAIYLVRVRRHNRTKPAPEARRFAIERSINGTYQPPRTDSPGGHSRTRTGSGLSREPTSELVSYYESRMSALFERVRELEAQLDEAVAAGGRSDTGALLMAKTRQLTELQGEYQLLRNRLDEADDSLQFAHAEVSNLKNELQHARRALAEERKTSRKLAITLEIERDANAQAQAVIERIRHVDVSDMSDSAASSYRASPDDRRPMGTPRRGVPIPTSGRKTGRGRRG